MQLGQLPHAPAARHSKQVPSTSGRPCQQRAAPSRRQATPSSAPSTWDTGSLTLETEQPQSLPVPELDLSDFTAIGPHCDLPIQVLPIPPPLSTAAPSMAKKLLAGKTALITGGSQGMGKAIAQKFAENGASLILTARRANVLEEAAAKCRELGAPNVHTYSVDLSNGEEVDKLGKDLAEKGAIDILVNNAGMHTSDNIIDGDLDTWVKLLRLNLEAPVRLSRHIIPSMVKKGAGTVINIGSLAGWEHRGKEAIYSSSKFGVTGFSKSTHEAMINKGVKVMLVIPEMVGSDMATGRGNVEKMIHGSDIAQVCLLPFQLSPWAVPTEVVVRNTVSWT